jgi:phosphoribosylanthranilate isomerase
MMFVKICGITRLEDARAATAAGASAIGFIFWEGSPRFIDPDRAKAIASAVPSSMSTVGVFVNTSAAQINAVADAVGLQMIQLHGDETPADAAAVRRPIIKAIGSFDDALVDQWPEDVTLLVDAQDPVRRGGTGRPADWERAAALARRRRVLLAGGLSAENVAEAIRAVRPFGIDVSSGVERSPGIKDHERLAALFQAVQQS